MASRHIPTTHRTEDPDEEAPPPYALTDSSPQAPPVSSPLVAPTHRPSYPVLDTSHLQTSVTVDPPPPHPLSFYPVLPSSPVTTVHAPPPHNPAFQPYPVYSGPFSIYPGSQPMGPPPGNVLGQAYPSMPPSTHVAMSHVPMTFQEPTAPFGWQNHPPSTFPPMAPVVPEPSMAPMAPVAPIVPPATEHHRSSQGASVGNLINFDSGTPPSLGSTSTASLNSSSQLSPMLVPSIVPLTPTTLSTLPIPDLVTNYRCAKCGATLESETAVCKRIHGLTTKLTEKQIRQATQPPEEGSSAESSSSRSHPSDRDSGNDSLYSTDIYEGYSQFHPRHRTSDNSDIYEGYSKYHPHRKSANFASSSRQDVTSEAQRTLDSNHGTSDVYLRRSVSVQTPMTGLKKFWREVKREVKSPQTGSQASSSHHIVSPPPLTLPHVPGAGEGVARSNTYAGNRHYGYQYEPQAPLAPPYAPP